VILDTGAVSSLFAGDAALAEVLEAEERHHLPVIVLGEYRYGLIRSRHRGRLGRMLDLLTQESHVLAVVEETTHHYARIREELRRLGRPIPENDVWIGALAQQHDQPVVSRDDHFDLIAGLTRIGW
jgi:predicted nucleic acid-binding protein